MKKTLFLTFFLFIFAFSLSNQELLAQTPGRVSSPIAESFRRATAALNQPASLQVTPPLIQAVPDSLPKEFNLSYNMNLPPIHNRGYAPVALFSSVEKAAYTAKQQTGKGNKKWQVAMFLAAENRPTEETLNILRSQIKKGNLAQAVVISFREETPDKPGDFYLLYNSAGSAVTEHSSISAETDASALFSMLFSHFSDTSSRYYTGLIVDAHGSGAQMFYAKDGEFPLWEVLKEVKNAGLKIDVMDLQSCHMGAIYNVYDLATYKSVRYVLLSSDINVGNSSRNYYYLLESLALPPYKAAVNSSELSSQKMQGDGLAVAKDPQKRTGSSTTYNSILLSMDKLSESLVGYFKSYGAIKEEEGMDENLKKIFRHEDDWRSFLRVVNTQARYVRENKDLQDKRFKRFLDKSDEVKQALSNALLRQWCYSGKHEMLYINRIPDNGSGCINGISAIDYQIEWILEDFPAENHIPSWYFI